MLYHQNQLHDIRLDLENNRIVFLYGDLGAGKTSLIRSIFRNQLSITSEVTSPTYSYYNKYQDDTYHFDLYRLEKYDEFFAIAGEDIIDS
jgi:tRNA threonylcarbamoyladenosine biosynthesis protein TsaE